MQIVIKSTLDALEIHYPDKNVSTPKSHESAICGYIKLSGYILISDLCLVNIMCILAETLTIFEAEA